MLFLKMLIQRQLANDRILPMDIISHIIRNANGL